ncbi:uncharacterized mitochondrial protein AtMg00310-like [Telopea speciosissima]|uniref:uncharacterized mitochondrial protein AtMg00310-like n=1 Tax=Telopea speciosissima TaxID=54955 RepID=UPI001CC622E5|nr:uncharacterized mitochondrial protein AtMg00310-like [Telopea speciosissima]
MLDLIRKRLQLWKGKLLSYAGRLVLIRLVLESSYIYWSSIYNLPQATIKSLESLFASFLWKGKESSRFLHPLSWAAVCLPKKEEGLGIRRIKEANSAGIIKLIWKIVSKQKSIWVDWIYSNLLRQDSIWSASATSDSSWVWCKILDSRHLVLHSIRTQIGDGLSTYLWLDHWHPKGILINMISPRTIYASDLHRLSLVADILGPAGWSPPPTASQDLTLIWNDLATIPRKLSNRGDCVLWKASSSSSFSSNSA